jgi:hypothetical protein
LSRDAALSVVWSAPSAACNATGHAHDGHDMVTRAAPSTTHDARHCALHVSMQAVGASWGVQPRTVCGFIKPRICQPQAAGAKHTPATATDGVGSGSPKCANGSARPSSSAAPLAPCIGQDAPQCASITSRRMCTHDKTMRVVPTAMHMQWATKAQRAKFREGTVFGAMQASKAALACADCAYH